MQLLASEEYGLRCLLQVARGHGVAPVTLSEIATAEGLSIEYAAKLLRQLRMAGLVTSRRGPTGGYQLCRAPGQITVWDVLEALGGDFFARDFCDCHKGLQLSCVHREDCALRALWGRVRAALRETLGHVSLDDLRRNEGAMELWLSSAAEQVARIQLDGAPPS